MARDLGTKYTCFKCGTKFYDLKKPIPVCPKCGADQREAPSPKAAGSRQRAPVPPREVEEPEVAAVEEEDAEAEEEEKEDEKNDD